MQKQQTGGKEALLQKEVSLWKEIYEKTLQEVLWTVLVTINLQTTQCCMQLPYQEKGCAGPIHKGKPSQHAKEP